MASLLHTIKANAIVVEVPLPGLSGNYDTQNPLKGETFEFGAIFKRISSISIKVISEGTSGTYSTQGIPSGVEVHPLGYVFDFKLLNDHGQVSFEVGSGSLVVDDIFYFGGTSNNSPFIPLLPTAPISPPDVADEFYNFILSGEGELSVVFKLPDFESFGGTLGAEPNSEITSLSLIIEGAPIPEPASISILLLIGIAFIKRK